MKTKKITAYTLEELRERKSKLKMVYSILGIFMLVAFTVLCYLAYTTKNVGLYAVAMGSLCTFAPGLASIAQINKEIKARQQN